MLSSKKWKRRLLLAFIALLIAFFAAASATFAWYIYNSRAHTTNVHMAAGSATRLLINDSYNDFEDYTFSTQLASFTGTLNPVSTSADYLGEFRKVLGFTNGDENQPSLVASLFGGADASDFYKTTLFLRTEGDPLDIYLSDITYEDSDPNNPISTAIRVGFVTHEPGEDMPEADKFIFAINTDPNPSGSEYNTKYGQEGYVLDLSVSNENLDAVVEFTPYTKDNYCIYDKITNTATLKPDSVRLLSLDGTQPNGDLGDAVQVDVYIWLEGCDSDCTTNLNQTTLYNIALSFAGINA